MKKILLIATFLVYFAPAKAQNCIADTTITEAGIYPETLDTAQLDVPYAHTFQVLAIKDTVVDYLGNIILAEIDSVKVVKINGLPASFQYVCEPTNCVFTWEKVSCIKLEGNPTAAEEGVHPLEIITTAYARWGLLRLPVNDTITDYTLVVGDGGSASIYTPSKEKVAVYPNPSLNGTFYIQSNTAIYNLQIVDVQGKETMFTHSSNNNITTIDISNSSNGIYFVSFNAGSRLIKKRIMY
jgi:hypothetical protein